MDNSKNTKWIVLDDKDNKITESNNKDEVLKDIELFALLKTQYGVRLIKS
ncbi:unnamed protein product [marine sediment metagenome]|uniref:Uncharacterized protein n=1 Tax=marine sediment metagenome TaxID=412755 RepID=X1S8N0_9ZZZZ